MGNLINLRTSLVYKMARDYNFHPFFWRFPQVRLQQMAVEILSMKDYGFF
jgi:hypothetical protein